MFCLILFLFASQVLPVNGAGVLMMVLAIALFAAEVKVTSYGLLTLAGCCRSSAMMMDSDVPAVRVPLSVVLPGAIGIAVGALALVRMVLNAQRLHPTTGVEGMSGRMAVAEEPSIRRAGCGWRASAGAADSPVAAVSACRWSGRGSGALRVRRQG